MSEGKERYFNYPVSLHKNFMTHSKEVLDDIFDYAVYNHSKTLEVGTELEKFKSSSKYFGFTLGNAAKSFKNGKDLCNTTDLKTPKTGINCKIWFDFYKNEKTEFEKICLLAFLAIKSIVQSKSYIKIDNKFWLSRMAGFSKSVDLDVLPSDILKYSNEYQTKKIKTELRNNWGLVTYSRYTRGFYVSFQMKLEDLIFEAEKRRKSTKDKQHKQRQDEAVKKALSRLGVV